MMGHNQIMSGWIFILKSINCQSLVLILRSIFHSQRQNFKCLTLRSHDANDAWNWLDLAFEANNALYYNAEIWICIDNASQMTNENLNEILPKSSLLTLVYKCTSLTLKKVFFAIHLKLNEDEIETDKLR